MRRLAIGLACALLLAAGLLAATGGFEQISVGATAIGLTLAKVSPPGARQMTIATCRLEAAEIRWTRNGTVPTASVGILAEIGDTIRLTGHDDLVTFLAIETTATPGQLDCDYQQ